MPEVRAFVDGGIETAFCCNSSELGGRGDGMRPVPICPHFGHPYCMQGDDELDFDEFERVEFECPACEKSFVATKLVNIVYVTEVTE